MTTKKSFERTDARQASSESTRNSVIAEAPYVGVSWHQEFFDEEDKQIISYEFKVPPAQVSIGEFVEFAFLKDKGRVIDVRHYIRDNLTLGKTEDPHLRHFIQIKINTNSDSKESF